MLDRNNQGLVEIMDLDEGGERKGLGGVLGNKWVRWGMLVGLVLVSIVLYPVVEQSVSGLWGVDVKKREGVSRMAEPSFSVFSFVDREHVSIYLRADNDQQGRYQRLVVLRSVDGQQIQKKRLVEGSFVWQTKSGLIIVKDKDDYLSAVDSVTQSVRWRSKVQGVWVYEDKTVLYVLTERQRFLALNVETGGIVWETSEILAGDMMVGEDVMCVNTANAGVFVLGKQDGKVLWRQEAGRCQAVKDGVVYTSDADGMVRARKGMSGQELWRKRVRDATPGSVTGMEVRYIDQDFLFEFTHFGPEIDASTLAVGSVLRVQDGKEMWSMKRSMRLVAFEKGVLYVQDELNNHIRALRVTDGKQIWEYKEVGSAVINMKVLDGVVYMDLGHGTVSALELATGKRVWVRQYARDINMDMVVDGERGMLYIVSSPEHRVRAVRVRDGSVVWERKVYLI